MLFWRQKNPQENLQNFLAIFGFMFLERHLYYNFHLVFMEVVL